MGWASQYSLLAFLKLRDALIPSANDLANTDLELERVTSCHARVKHGPVFELSCVVHLHCGALRNYRPSAFVELLNLQRSHLNKALSDKLFDLVGVLGHTAKLINQVPVTDKVDHGHVLDLEPHRTHRNW